MVKKYFLHIDIIFDLFYIINNWNIFSLRRDYFCGFFINPRGLGVSSVLVAYGSLFFFSLNNYVYNSLESDKMSAD
jgi:hypothetical protein